MQRRPWPIVILAFFHWLAPLFNLLLCSWSLSLAPSEYLRLMLLNESRWQIAEFFTLLPLCGLAIFFIKKWSYPAFLLGFGWNIYSNYVATSSAPGTFSMGLMTLAYVFNFAIVSYFVIPAVRAAYFNPRLRWWESQPRFLLNCLGEFKVAGRSVPCTVLNISRGGAFICTDQTLKPSTEIELTFSVLTAVFVIRAASVYRRAGDTEGYGVQFIHSQETLKQVTALLRSFALLGIRRRPLMGSAWEEFKLWAKTLVTTGKGWKPELPELGSKN